MSRTLPLLAAALCAAVFWLTDLQRCQGAEPPPAEQKIEGALRSPTVLEFIETPLQDVVDYLKDYHGIEIQIDKKALEEVGIESETAITANLKGLSLKSALNLMLRELDLTYLVGDEVLLITTPEEAENRLTAKVYPVADLITRCDVGSCKKSGGSQADYDTMINMITSTIEPESWDEVGGPGSIVGATIHSTETLVISQSYHVHRKIAALLEQLRKVAGGKQPATDRPSARRASKPSTKPFAKAGGKRSHERPAKEPVSADDPFAE